MIDNDWLLSFAAMSALHILLIEDDVHAAALVCDGLRFHGHKVEVAADGCAGLIRAENGMWDVLIIDRMLPGLDGLVLVRRLRDANIKIPVLILTALDGINERMRGFQAGGNDYLVKPFALSELAARVAALARKGTVQPIDTVLRVNDLELDQRTHHTARAGQPINLKPLEYALLEYLMCHTGCLVTRAMLLENVWGFQFNPRTTVIESHISRLRRKIDDGFTPQLLHTIRDTGYRLGDAE